MIKALTIAAGALALGLAAHAPASAGAVSAGALSATVIDATPGGVAWKATYGYRVPARAVLHKLRRKGYSGFSNIRWLRHAYLVRAHNWRGKPVRIKVNAYSGNIVWVKTIHHNWRHWRY